MNNNETENDMPQIVEFLALMKEYQQVRFSSESKKSRQQNKAHFTTRKYNEQTDEQTADKMKTHRAERQWAQMYLHHISQQTCYEPGDQKAVECAVKRVCSGIVVILIFLPVSDALHYARQILDHTKTPTNYQIDWNILLSWAVIQIYGS